MKSQHFLKLAAVFLHLSNSSNRARFCERDGRSAEFISAGEDSRRRWPNTRWLIWVSMLSIPRPVALGLMLAVALGLASSGTTGAPLRFVAEVNAAPIITADKLDQYLTSKISPMSGLGAIFINASRQYNVDPRLIVAIAGAESTFGKNGSCATERYNAWGWGGGWPDCWAFASWTEGIERVTRGLSEVYLGQGLTTIREIGQTYCGSGCENWKTNVAFFYQDELRGDTGDLTFVQGLSTQPIADGFDYPVGTPQTLGGTGYVTQERDDDGWFNAQDFGPNNHLGEDWNGNEGGDNDLGKPVYAVANGEVVYAQNAGIGWSNVIAVRHDLANGTSIISMYAHLRSVAVTRGDGVRKGQKIGEIGKDYPDKACQPSGKYCAHLHFELRTDTTKLIPGFGYSADNTGWVDPSDFIDANREPETSNMPLAGDWNGDGIDTPGMYDSGTAVFSFYDRQCVQVSTCQNERPDQNFGEAGDLLVTGDWNGDSVDTIGVYRPSNSTFYLTDDSNNSNPVADYEFPIGQLADTPVAGDWDGDGRDSIGVYRPSNSSFYLTNDLDSANPVVHHILPFGQGGDVPIVGDWDGDGNDDIGVFRSLDPNPNTNRFYLDLNLSGDQHEMVFDLGDIGDVPIVGDWDGDGNDNLGVFRPSTDEILTKDDLPPTPTITISGGDCADSTHCSGPLSKTTFTVSGTGFTPGGTFTQRIQPPGGSVFGDTTSVLPGGTITWDYTSKCIDQLGKVTIWVVDDATTLESNKVYQTNTSSLACEGILSVTPDGGLTSSGAQGGPFSPSEKTYTLTNTGGSSITWTVSNTQSWVTVSPSSGNLGKGEKSTLTVSVNSDADSLSAGSYSDTVGFTNTTNGNRDTRPVSLTVLGNDPPVAAGKSLDTKADTPVTVTLSATDVDDCELSFAIVTNPRSGSLGTVTDQSCTSGSPNADSALVVYTPNTGFSGKDSFTYKAADSGSLNNNVATVTITVGPAAADLSLTKIGLPDHVNGRQNVTYTITTTNNGPSKATGVTVTDVLPGGDVTFMSASPGCTEAFHTVTCDLGSLANGASAEVIIKVTLDVGEAITNTATVTGNETDPNPSNNSASETTTVIRVPSTAFSASPTGGLAPLVVHFTDQSTGSPTSWEWSFGDGFTSQDKNPSHTYTKADTYTVELTTSNDEGSDTLTLQNYITVDTPSHDGKIVFTSDRDGVLDIYIMDPNGNPPTRLTSNSGNHFYPTLSPDGKKIAFLTSRDGNFEIYRMDIDGTNQVNLSDNPASEWTRPAWSPDSTKIAFSSERDGNFEIYVMNAADGSNQMRLTNSPGNDYQPDWSPDGSKIAFASNRDGNHEIYVMNTNRTGLTRLTNNSSDDWYPDWSPDGTKIAFWSDRDGNREIYKMNANGDGQTNLTNNVALDVDPSWSPDGNMITFVSIRDGNVEIYKMNANGGGQTNLTNNAAADQDPHWGSASGDTTPPAAIADLEIIESTAVSLTLRWTAPGDDGNAGTASQYDMRYSRSPITETNWDSATQVTGMPSPQAPGSTQTFMLSSLSSDTLYYIGMKTADEVPNWSRVSNVVSGSTQPPPGTTVVSIDPLSQEVKSEETFTVGIQVEPATAIAGVQFDLSFDSSLVTLRQVEEGNLLSMNGANTFFQPGTIDNNSGHLIGVVGVITTPESDVSSTGTFATLTFTAKEAEGKSSLAISNVIVGDKGATRVPITIQNASVTIVPCENWDVNCDEKVNVLDMITIGQNWGATGPIGWISEDVNEDGKVNVLDMILVGQHWSG